MSYQSLILASRSELQNMLNGLDPRDSRTEDLLRILKGLDHELGKAMKFEIDRFDVVQNQDGWGRDLPGLGLCLTSEGSLVRYSDHLQRVALALGEQP